MVLGVVIAIVALSDLFSGGPWRHHWGWPGGFGFFFGVVALALAVVLLSSAGRGGGSALRALAITVLVALAAIIVTVTATLFTVEALSGVPLSGGIGDSQVQPTAPSQLRPNYRQAMGNLTVDLRDVAFRPGTTHLTATVGIGHLLVEVPFGTSVSVNAHSGLGQVQVFGQDDSGLSVHEAGSRAATGDLASSSVVTPASPHLVLDAETGVGQVQVVRG
jgi:hypothetical protein